MTTGEKIAALRREKGMNQEELAEQLGISRQAVSKWEAGVAEPSTENYKKLGKIFGVPADALFNPDRTAGAPEQAGAENPPLPESGGQKPRRAGHTGMKIVSAAVSVAALLWAVALQVQLGQAQRELAEVRRLAQASGEIVTVQQPAPEPELLDWAVRVTAYDPQSNRLSLHVEAAPVTFSTQASARFCIRDAAGAAVVPAVDAVLADGWFGADLDWEMTPTADRPAVYLLLEQEGEHRTIHVETVDYFMSFLTVHFQSRLTEGMTSLDRTNATVGTTITYADELTGMDYPELSRWEAYPVSGSVTLYADGQALQTQQIPLADPHETAPVSPDGAPSEMGGDVTYYTHFELEFPEKAEDVWFEIELTDNFGRQYTEHLDSIWPN